MEFSNAEKIKLFEEIEKRYFRKNFGSMSKSDFEVLLFSEYIEHHIENKIPYDDYTLSKELGITESKVRNLKEKKELQYPYKNFYWKDAFVEYLKNAKYDEVTHRIKIPIHDVNVMKEIRHYIEQNGWYDEITLNKKLLTIPLDCFIDICFELDKEIEFSEECKNKIKKLKNSENVLQEFIKDFSKEGLKNFAMKASKNVLCEVIGTFSSVGILGKIMQILLNIIEK